MKRKNYISPEFEEILLFAEDMMTDSLGISTGGQDPDGDEYGEYHPIF